MRIPEKWSSPALPGQNSAYSACLPGSPIAAGTSQGHQALVAQLDRASASGAEGHRFESCRAHGVKDLWLLYEWSHGAFALSPESQNSNGKTVTGLGQMPLEALQYPRQDGR